MSLSKKECTLLSKMVCVAQTSMLNCKHCCCLVVNSKIVALGINTSRSRLGRHSYMCCHAERNAVHYYTQHVYKLHQKKDPRRFKKKMAKVTLWVIRSDQAGNIKNSAPCSSCTHLIRSVGIKKIVYSNKRGTLTKTKIANYCTQHVSSGFKITSRY